MRCQIYSEECVCPMCKGMFNSNVDIGDGFLYDICGCGFKRKKKPSGEIVADISLSESIRRMEAKRKDEGRELI
ncbi:hypothetical protein LCGC14_3058310 [marine sediment metagenome]|uniref:Uncharacterized protein n=1 Tax=marine sediment metagenome TaxID=412755 RepID=A0A0F8WK70_9ZZZZ